VNVFHLLAVVAVLQTVFLAMIVLLLLFNRQRRDAFHLRRQAAQRLVGAPTRRWLVGEESVEHVVEALNSLRPDEALGQLVHLATQSVPANQIVELTSLIRDTPWVRSILGRARSYRWWRRLEAARLLAVVGGPGDRDLFRKLLKDKHPAVQSVATAGLPRVVDLDSVAFVLDNLPHRAVAVRLYQFSMLRETYLYTEPVLLARLTFDAAPEHLEVWISLAEAVGSYELLHKVLTLRTHPQGSVRLAVARALRKFYHPEAPPALRAMVADPDWRVRAQAARALGTLADTESVPLLKRSLADVNWWVRFRSGLALAQLGEPGRAALRECRTARDRYASDMAAMISGLSSGSIIELSEG
jgi:HEAT repeat protein